YDYKFLISGILLCVGLAGAGYMLCLALPLLIPNELQDFDCTSLNRTTFNDYGYKYYKTLDDYKQGCKEIQLGENNMVKQTPILLAIIPSGLSAFVIFGIFQCHKIGESLNDQ